VADTFASRFARAPGEAGPVGAVVAPVRLEPELDLASAQALFLAPGAGAQGATPEDVARALAPPRSTEGVLAGWWHTRRRSPPGVPHPVS
jgi:orotidine-5'-phosphate decarboxylase